MIRPWDPYEYADECPDCGLPPELCHCDAPCDLCGNDHERGVPCFEDDSCECGTWPCTCDQYGYDDFSEDFSDDWESGSIADEPDDFNYWSQRRFVSKSRLCRVCDLPHDERICDLWRSGDVRAVRALMLPEEAESGPEENDPDCESMLEERPWEVLRRQLEEIEAERKARHGR